MGTRYLSSPAVFSGVRVARSFFSVYGFVACCLCFWSFFFWLLCCLLLFELHFWLPLWYLQLFSLTTWSHDCHKVVWCTLPYGRARVQITNHSSGRYWLEHRSGNNHRTARPKTIYIYYYTKMGNHEILRSSRQSFASTEMSKNTHNYSWYIIFKNTVPYLHLTMQYF